MTKSHSHNAASRSGFSLLELIVVLGVLFLLAAILLPALSIARQKAQTEQCLNNLHQLTTAWLMYASANSDRCANNFGESAVMQELSSKTYRTWCVQIEDLYDSSSSTNAALLRLGQLAPYTGGNITHFKCPADTFLTPEQVKAGFQGRLRSYSMSAFFGLYSPGNEGVDSTYQGRNFFEPNYRQFLRISDLDVAQPSSMLLFVEMNAYSLNDGYFLDGDIPTTWDATTWGAFGDLPALYHHGETDFSFADGHSEIHQWQDNVLPPPTPSYPMGAINDKPPFNDIHWMWSHSSVIF